MLLVLTSLALDLPSGGDKVALSGIPFRGHHILHLNWAQKTQNKIAKCRDAPALTGTSPVPAATPPTNGLHGDIPKLH